MCSIENRIAVVTLNRPERLNAMGNEMGRQFDRVMVDLALNAEVRVVILTGAGRGFCAGADMERLTAFADSKGSAATVPRAGEAQGAYRALGERAPAEVLTRYCAPQALPQPVIAAVNGPCAGIGLVLALMCDVRLGSTAAKFVAPFVNRGLVAEVGVASTLGAIVGAGVAADLLLSGRSIGADEAFHIGLVNRLSGPDELIPEAMDYARRIAENASPRAARIIKQQLWRARSQSFAEALAFSMDETRSAMKSADFAEGLASFREKRPPRFTGS